MAKSSIRKNIKIIGSPGRLVWIDPKKLQVDSRYQRLLDEGRANGMAKGFDYSAIKTINVSERPNGDLFITDGQHTVGAAIACNIAKLPCYVCKIASVALEAHAFDLINGGRKSVSAWFRHRAKVAAGDKGAVAIQGIIDSFGIKLVEKGYGRMKCNAIGSIYQLAGKKPTTESLANLRGTFDFILKTWGGEHEKSFSGRFIMGVGRFLQNNRHNVLLLERARGRLSAYDPDFYLTLAERNSKEFHKTVVDSLPKILGNTANHRARQKLAA
jgi:hypothetical protein